MTAQPDNAAPTPGEQGDPTNDQIEAAFDTWLHRVCPSGDVESVQRQWEESSDYEELFSLATPPAPETAESAAPQGVAGGWQLIATAPKNNVLWLYSPELVDDDFCPAGVVDGHWQDDEGWKGAVWNSGMDEWSTRTIEPTHWMLPWSPSLAQAGQAAPATVLTPDDMEDLGNTHGFTGDWEEMAREVEALVLSKLGGAPYWVPSELAKAAPAGEVASEPTTFPKFRSGFRTTTAHGPSGTYKMTIMFQSLEDLDAADSEIRAALATPATEPAAPGNVTHFNPLDHEQSK